MDTTHVVRVTLFALLTYSLSCYPVSWRSYHQPNFLPGPQFCPETGRTLCTAVDSYPTDQIYHLLSQTRSQGFNLSSLFVDERRGDVEPYLPPPPTPQPEYKDSGYSSPQYSPAGYDYNNWNANSGTTPYPELQPDRWKPAGTPRPDNVRNAYGPGGSVSNSRTGGQGFNYEPRNGFENYPFPGQSGSFEGQNRNQSQLYPPNGGQSAFPLHPGQRIKGGQINPPDSQNVRNWKGSPFPVNNNNGAVGNSQLHDNSQGSAYSSRRRKRRNEDSEVACEARTTFLPPRAALNDNSEWKYVVNVPERDRRFTQVIKVDICQSAGQPCSSRISFPFGFEGRCKQKYIKKKLLSLNPDGQGTSEDNFFIPSCCVCEIVRTDDRK